MASAIVQTVLNVVVKKVVVALYRPPSTEHLQVLRDSNGAHNGSFFTPCTKVQTTLDGRESEIEQGRGPDILY